MGKEPQNATSKGKSPKNAKAAPSWREKLAEYDLNNIYEGRTCEIILMAELTLSHTETVALFHMGAKTNPTNVIKSINFEEFKNEIKHTKQGVVKTKSKGDATSALLQSATAEALQFLSKEESIPVELTAQLLKLKMINMINEDVTLRDEERRLEIKKHANEVAGKKDKTEKEKDSKKGKGKAAAIKLPIEERQLYFLINGIYEPDLAQEFYNIQMPLTAILELASPDCLAFKEKFAARSSGSARTSMPTLSSSLFSNNDGEVDQNDEEIVIFVNKFYAGSKESVCYSLFGGELSSSSISASMYEKIARLNYFWDTIYKGLEGELQAKWLENSAHIRINPIADKNAQDIFLEIAGEMLKISTAKRQHVNYLNNLKVYQVELKPKNKPAEFWKTYKKLMDVVPSDCFTIELLVYCLVEDVSGRVPNLKAPIKLNPTPPRKSSNQKRSSPTPMSSTDIKKEPSGAIPNQLDREAKSLKNIANYVIQRRKMYSPSGRCSITYRKNHFDQKLTLNLSRKPLIIHEHNWLEYKLNTYQELSEDLLKLNLNYLKKCSAALLWKLYPQQVAIEVIYKNHQLETWRNMFNLSTEEIQCALSAIQFDLLECSAPKQKATETKNSLQALFPGKNESEILNAATPHIKYIQTPEVSLTTLNDRHSCLRIPDVPYSDFPNIYEAKNIPTYLWYEKLPRQVMLQQLQKANADYICVDHKYCPYNDALILRYHNNIDAFGVNSKIWNQSLRTPLCFRDFCKYILYDEVRWLEGQEYRYQQKLRACQRSSSMAETSRKSSKRTSMKCIESDAPFSFLSYGLGKARVQLTGATTVFHSMDGYKITIDRTNFIGRPNNLSVNVAISGHNFILHYNKATLNAPLMFHFYLADRTTVVFAKPPPCKAPEISMAEKSAVSKAKPKIDKSSAYQARKSFYYVTEIKRWYLKTVTAPSVARSGSVLDENFASRLLQQIKKIRNSAKTRRRKRGRKATSEKCTVDEAAPENSKEVLTLFTSPNVQKEKTLDLKAEAECIAVLSKIEEAKTLQIPMFKVFSSKLHKFEYIKRIKSFIRIRIGKHTVTLLCRHPTHNITRNVEVVKVIPIKLTDFTYHNNNRYDMKVCLPSSLLVYTAPGANDQPFNIKQRYLEKNVYCKNVLNEDSRTFTRNGRVVIKNGDGTLDILSVNGQIVHCGIPHSAVNTHVKYKLKTRPKKNQQAKLASRLFRIVNWRRRHIIGGSESRYFKYRRINLRQHRLLNRNLNNIYLMKKSSTPSFQYVLITHDGKQLQVTDTHVRRQNNFYQATHTYQYYDQYINLRDDGTTSLIRDDGMFIAQFSDKTKISSWFAESPELVILENEDDSTFGLGSMSSVFYDQLINSGWILVQMFYKFEHPNYATILLSSDNFETEVVLPNNVVLNVTENGHYFLEIDKTLSSVVNDELVYLESKSCETCMQRSITVLNIKPLYDGLHPIDDNTELLKTCDSYEKVFLVNYNGRCYRNSNYVKCRKNRVECPHHDKEEYQQIFVLNRDLSGSKFWDIKAYRERIIEATDNSNTVLQYYGKGNTGTDYISLEMRTYKYQPYYMHFLNLNLISERLFSTCQNQPNPPAPAYTTLCHIYTMPKECMTKLLEASIMENNKRQAEFPKPDNENTPCRCVSQISRENMKLKERSVFDEHLKKVSSALLLLKKWYTWHELHKPYKPPDKNQICKCKSEPARETPKLVHSREIFADSFDARQSASSLEVVPQKSDLSFTIRPYKEPHKAVCECNIPANFICECRPIDNTIEEVKLFETKTNSDIDSKDRGSTIGDWSNEINLLEEPYICAEEIILVTNLEKVSISEGSMKQSQPPCKCNIDKKVYPRPPAPKHRARKMCAKETCHRVTYSESNTSLHSTIYKRQAGGADIPVKYTAPKKSKIKSDAEKRSILKRLHKRIIELVLAADTNKEVSARGVDRYKAAVIIDTISTIYRARYNIKQLTMVLKKLNNVDLNKYKILTAERLSEIIISLSISTLKRADNSLSPKSGTQISFKNTHHFNVTKFSTRSIKLTEQKRSK